MSCPASLSFFCCDEPAVDSISQSNKRYSFAIFMSELSREHHVPVMIVPSAIAKLNKQKKYVLLSKKSTSSQAPLCHGRSDSIRNISLFDKPFFFTDA